MKIRNRTPLFGKEDPKFLYKVRINYRSGIQEEFWCLDFSYGPNSRGIGTYNWTLPTTPYSSEMPVQIGPSDIESVWIVEIIKVPKECLE